MSKIIDIIFWVFIFGIATKIAGVDYAAGLCVGYAIRHYSIYIMEKIQKLLFQ